MATTHPPWKVLNFKTPMALFYHVASTDGPPPLDSYDLSPPLRALILRCFERDPQKRCHAADLILDPFLVALEDESDELSGTIGGNTTLDRIEALATPKDAPPPPPEGARRLALPQGSPTQGSKLSDLKMRMSLRQSTAGT